MFEAIKLDPGNSNKGSTHDNPLVRHNWDGVARQTSKHSTSQLHESADGKLRGPPGSGATHSRADPSMSTNADVPSEGSLLNLEAIDQREEGLLVRGDRLLRTVEPDIIAADLVRFDNRAQHAIVALWRLS